MLPTLSLSRLVAAAVLVLALPAAPGAWAQQSGPSGLARSSVDRMQSIMDALQGGNLDSLSPQDQQAVKSGLESAERTGADVKVPQSTRTRMTQHTEAFEQLAREAYVAALPPRDQARGRALLMGDGTLPGNDGKLYIFVSRSMPLALLRAYAVEAFYIGATLITKGIRRGDTILEYVTAAMSDFNSADNQHLAGMEINPNLFDMFGVNVVPAVVWTNRVGLDDIGAGCQNLPDGQEPPKIELEGPFNNTIVADKPVCALAAPASYYKIAGALKMEYVLDRFEEAGLAREATEPFRRRLAERAGNVFTSIEVKQQAPGNALTPLQGDITFDRLPRYVLESYKEDLKTLNVQRGPYGPAFSAQGKDDPEYRKELTNMIERGLNL